MRQTTMAKPADVTRTWYVVDGNGQTLGRLASTCAHVLKGKHKPTYTPNVDCGDYVIVINADKVEMTGNKLNTEKYYNHSGYFGGMRVRTAKEMKEKYPVEWVERAIKGMLPHTKLGDVQRGHVFVYAGSEHPHAAQKPVELNMKKSNTVQYHGVGRRKKSVARVFLRPGTGNIVVNGKTLEEYLPLETLRMVVKSPLEITNTVDQFDVIINVQGGGYTGQSGAMRHGITRALMEASEDYRPVLKAAGFVTRDPRAKERKKYGLKAARRAPQFSKR